MTTENRRQSANLPELYPLTVPMANTSGSEGPSCIEASCRRPKWSNRYAPWKNWKIHGVFSSKVPKQPYRKSIDRPSEYKSGEDVVESDSVVDVQSAREESPLLYCLPVEIRLLIYDYLFCDHVYHLGRIPTFPVTSDYHHPFSPRTPFRWIPPYTPLGHHPLFPRPPEVPPEALELQTQAVSHTPLELFRDKHTNWAMLLISRQIYHETVGVFYNASILRFDNPHVLLELATNHLRARRFLAVKHLDIV